MLRLEQAREAVRAASPLEEVLPRYEVEVHGRGRERTALCPFHPDTDPSLGINVEEQLWFCQGCKAGGDVFNFVQQMEGLSHVQAVRRLAELCTVDLSLYESEQTAEERLQAVLLGYMAQVADWALEQRVAKAFRQWHDRRQFLPDVTVRYGVGYAPGLPEVDAGRHARRLQLDHPVKWGKRVVVPLHDESGRPVAFRTRSIDGSQPKVHGHAEDHPLEVPPLYGFHQARQAIKRAGQAILVEGETDVWQMAAHGYENVLAVLGSSFTEVQARWLAERGVRRVVYLPDGDKAGRESALWLVRQRYPVHISIAELEEGDPDEALLADPDMVAEALRRPVHVLEYAVDYVIRQHDGAETLSERMEVLYGVAELLAKAPGFEREQVLRYLAVRLDFTYEHLVDYFQTTHAPEAPLYNARAEQALLQAALVDEKLLMRLVLDLRSEDFYLHRHRRVFDVVGELFREGKAVRPDTVALVLRNRGIAQDAAYVESLQGAPLPDVAVFLLEDLRDKSLRRRIHVEAQRLSNVVFDLTVPGRGVLEDHAARVGQLVTGQGGGLRPIDVVVKEQMAVMHQRIAEPSLILGLDFGPEWPVLNHTVHGLQAGRYFVLAAPSGVGKTAVCCEWVKRFAVHDGHPVLFATFETGDAALALRMQASLSGVEFDKIVTGFLTEDEVEQVQEAGMALGASPLVITSRGALVEEFLALVRTDIVRRDTKLVVVDYLQLMQSTQAGKVNRYTELGDISRALFNLAGETGVAVVAVAQINREGARKSQAGGTDVGDSFRIFQDCDYFYVVNDKTPEDMEIDGLEQGNRYGNLAKSRHGRDNVGTSLLADLGRMRIREVTTTGGNGARSR